MNPSPVPPAAYAVIAAPFGHQNRLEQVGTYLQQSREHLIMASPLRVVDFRDPAEPTADVLQRRTGVPPCVIDTEPPIV
jgi:hypothetical protein